VPLADSRSGKQSLLDHLVRPAQLFETSSLRGPFSEKLKCDLHDAKPTLSCRREPASLEYSQHRDIFRQNIRDQFIDSGLAGNRAEMPHQYRPDTLTLIRIYDGESHLCLRRLADDISRSPDDHRSPAFVHHRDQGHVVDEIDVHKRRDFRLADVAF